MGLVEMHVYTHLQLYAHIWCLCSNFVNIVCKPSGRPTLSVAVHASRFWDRERGFGLLLGFD